MLRINILKFRIYLLDNILKSMENENKNDLAVKFKNTCGKWVSSSL